jgi:hypothetical protein
MLSMFSSEAILAILAFSDMENALRNVKNDQKKRDDILFILHVLLFEKANIFKRLVKRYADLANPFFPFGGLRPLAASSFTCLSIANSSARAARLKIVLKC